MITTVALSLALAAAPAALEPRAAPDASLVLVVASNRGTRGARPALRYADDDAAKYHEVLATIAGEENTILLTDFDRDTARLFPALLEKARSPTRAQLDLAVARLARRSAELARAGRTVRFHFVFAGHGDVDEGRGFLELADGPFTSEDLQEMLRAVGAAESHVILDSCNSFFVVNPRRPGGRRFATPREAVEALARRLPNVGVFLSTSAQAEVYEWSELQSGVFSHAVRSGLMGAADVNRDGNVSYEELGAFVETAAADIKNPLYRPTVYARGPNGEDARPILVVPRAARAALTVDDPGAVRLAARDADGLRWVDLHKDAGAAVTLWFPPSVARRLEVDRLKPGTAGPVVEATFALPEGEDAPPRLSELTRSRPVLAMRGAGDIFQALFGRPFGEPAFAAWVARRGAEPALALDPAPAPIAAAPAVPPAPAPASRGASPAFYVAARPGALVPWFYGSGAIRLYEHTDASGTGITLAAGRQLDAHLAVELEGGYQDMGETLGTFIYPSDGFPGEWIPGTAFRAWTTPVAVNVRAQLGRGRVRPYAILGGGGMFAELTVDPPDFNATLRESSVIPFAHAGLGLHVDLGDHAFLGGEARFFATREARMLGGTIGFLGVNASLVAGLRL